MKQTNIDVRKKLQKKSVIKSYALSLLIVIITVTLLIIFPEKQPPVTKTIGNMFIELIQVLPVVMILVGLISVWVPREMIIKYLGNASGLKGALLSILFGSMPMGPLYLAFPLAVTLIGKGASIGNIMIFLSAWACLKIPFIVLELQFFGLPFMLTRVLSTAVLVIIMGTIIQRIAGKEQLVKPAN